MRTRAMRLATTFTVLIFLALVAAAADTLAQLQAKFDRESNPVHRAKLLQKLGDAQFEETRRAGNVFDHAIVALVLEKYRDNVRATFDGLKKHHPDAERNSNGYRQLESHVRRGIREVDDSLLLAPEQFKPPLELVRHDLAAIEDELIAMLFPLHTKPPAPKPPPAEKQP